MNKPHLRILFFVLLAVFCSSVVGALLPNEITVQGKLTNSSGYSLAGTYSMTFRVYDSFTSGTTLYTSTQSITTDSNGVYDTILRNVNLSFSDQYYLGITVGADSEAAPRINLTSNPYAFRSNVTEGLNPLNKYRVAEINVTGNFSVGQSALFVDSTNFLVGIGTPTPNDMLEVAGSVRVAGSFNASSINTSRIVLSPGGQYTTIGTTGGDPYTLAISSTTTGLDALIRGGYGIAGSSFYTPQGGVFGFGQTFVLGNYPSVGVDTGISRLSPGVIAIGSGLNGSTNGTLIARNIGIGTNTTTEKLTVIGNISATGNLSVGGTISAVAYNIGWTNLSNYPAACAPGEFITAVGDTLTCTAPGEASTAAGGWSNDTVNTRTNLNVIVDTNVLVVNTSTNRVGINTASMTNALDVVGDIRATGLLNSSSLIVNNTLFVNGSRVGIGTNNPSGKLTVGDGSSTADNLVLNSGNNANSLIFAVGGSGKWYFQPTGEDLYLSDGANYNFVLKDGGNVGIGQTSPNVTLGVSGSANITNVLYANHANFTTLFGVPLSEFNKSIDLSTYNKSVDLSTYNKSVSLVNYAFISQLGVYLTNNSAANFTAINVETLNGTALHLFNRSIDLTGYNKSIDLSTYNKSVSLTGYVTTQAAGAYLSNNTNAIFNTLTVNQNLYILGNITNVNVNNINVNGSILPSLTQQFDIGNGTMQWRNGNFSGSVSANDMSATTLNGLSVSTINRSISLTNYVTTAQAGAYLTNNSPANLTLVNVQTLNGTALNLFNRSVDLTGYNKSVDLSTYNKSVSLNLYNSSVSLANYAFISQLGVYLTNGSSANFTSVNVVTLNGTALHLFNRSVDLTGYNKSIDLSTYNKSVDLSTYNKSVSLVNYAFISQLGVYLTNGSSANFTSVNVVTLNGTALHLFNRSVDLTGYNKSIDLSTYNKSVDLSTYNKSVSLVNYAFISQLGVYLTNGSSANFTSVNVVTLNGTALHLFNRSIDLTLYNKSIDLSTYNKSVDLSTYNKSVSLANYAFISQLGVYLTNNSAANLTLVNVQTLNGTALNLFNRSVDLTGYNKSVDLSTYNKSVDLTAYQAEANGFKILNLTNFLGGSGANDSLIRSTNTTFFGLFTKVADAFNVNNLTGFFGYSSISDANASIIQKGNTSWVVSTISSQYPNLDTDSTNDLTLAALDNNTVIRTSNSSWFQGLYDAVTTRFGNANFTTLYDARTDRFGNVNFTTLYATNNATSSQWNSTSTALFPRDLGKNVGIGTATPSKALVVNGTTNAITFDPSSTIGPVMNTTGNNMTITSATGSVIIRLGG